MAYIGVTTEQGRILRAKMILEAITHVAIGEGLPEWGNNPPQPSPTQTSLVNERARKRYYKKGFLVEDPNGDIPILKDPDTSTIVYYREVDYETNVIYIRFRFEEWEAVGVEIREYGFFGDGVQYVDGVTGSYAENGVYDPVSNPNGQVLNSGKLYRVVNIPTKTKTSSDALEFIFFEKF